MTNEIGREVMKTGNYKNENLGEKKKKKNDFFEC